MPLRHHLSRYGFAAAAAIVVLAGAALKRLESHHAKQQHHHDGGGEERHDSFAGHGHHDANGGGLHAGKHHGFDGAHARDAHRGAIPAAQDIHVGDSAAAGHGRDKRALPQHVAAPAAPPAKDWCLPAQVTMEFEGDWRGLTLWGALPADGGVRGVAAISQNETDTLVYFRYLVSPTVVQEQWALWHKGGRAVTIGANTTLSPAAAADMATRRGSGVRSLLKLPLVRAFKRAADAAVHAASKVKHAVEDTIEELRQAGGIDSRLIADALTAGAARPALVSSCTLIEDVPATAANNPQFCAQTHDIDLRHTGAVAFGTATAFEYTFDHPRVDNATLRLVMLPVPIDSHGRQIDPASGEPIPGGFTAMRGKALMLPLWHWFSTANGSDYFVNHVMMNHAPGVDMALFEAMPDPSLCMKAEAGYDALPGQPGEDIAARQQLSEAARAAQDAAQRAAGCPMRKRMGGIHAARGLNHDHAKCPFA